MSNYNNINTGLAQKVEQFRLSSSLDDKPHVVGVYKSAPDFSIPPTPASSYQNIHVVLDTVHQSSLTRSTHTSLPINSYNVGQQSRSFSELPNNNFGDLRAVPDFIDPEQPGARSDAALTSLKSEIAPITPGYVDLEPETVDIGLTDETFASRQVSEKWDRMAEEERSWRMNRQVDSIWLKNWGMVGQQLRQPWALQEEEERLWRLRGGVDASWTQKWREVGNEIKGFNQSWLEQERSWRMTLRPDATFSRNWQQVGSEIRMLNFDFGDLTAWADKIAADVELQASSILRLTRLTVKEMGEAAAKYLDELESQPTLSWAKLTELEDAERDFRATLGHNAVLSGKWHRLGLELQSLIGTSWSEWLTSIKNEAVREIKSDYRALRHVELPAVKLPSFRNIQLPQVSLPNISLPEIKIVTKSEVTTPMWDDNMPVDFTFKSYRFSSEYLKAEEQERLDRMSRGINPVVAGKWYRLGLELKYRYSLRPTFASAARNFISEVEYIAEKATEEASELIGSFADSASVVVESAKESLTPSSHSDFIAHGRLHLNFFAYTADPVDFTFRKSRTPKSILALEERERRERIRQGPNRALLNRWQRVLNGGLPAKIMEGSLETFGESIIHAKDVFVEKTTEVLRGAERLAESAVPTGLSGLFGSFAHRVADRTSSFVEAAKETLHLTEINPASMKAEELERTRRLNEKVDPLTAARLGRVQEELLTFTIKSV